MTQFDQRSQQVGTQYNAEHITIQQQPLSLTEKQRKQNRTRMLQRVQSIWIEGVLEPSEQGATQVAPDLQNKPSAIITPLWHVLRAFDTTGLLRSADTSIAQVYDRASGEVLILGEPGAGKTTLLLELTRTLLERAGQDEAHPIPVVFSLSSWATRRQPLTEWLTAELYSKYQVPLPLARSWIDTDQVLPLLDGLDEVAAPHRAECIEAINIYRQAHGLLSTVVCSRQVDYLALSTRLLLRTAVVVQPLTAEQIETALTSGGEGLETLREVLREDADLRALASTPLMLNVLTVAYQGSSLEAIVQAGTDLEQRVWTDYVARMVQQKGNATRYPLERTRRWLAWLAQQMRVHQQTIFYAEYLHTDWLASNQQRIVTWLSIRVPALVLGVLAGLLVSLFVSGAFAVLPLQMGLLGGFLGGCLSQNIGTGTAVVGSPPPTSKRTALMSCVLLGVLVAASFGLFLNPGYSLGDWVRYGSIPGLASGLSAWIFQMLLFRIPGQRVSVPAKHPSLRWRVSAWFNTVAARRAWQAATVLGTGMGLSFGLFYGLRAGLSYGLITGLITGLFYGLVLRAERWFDGFASQCHPGCLSRNPSLCGAHSLEVAESHTT